MPIGAAAAIGGIASGAGSLLGGLFGANATATAAKQQAQAQQQAIQAQLAVQQVIQSQLAPWLQGGQNALGALQGGLGIGPGGGGIGTGTLSMSPLARFGLAPNIFTPGIAEEVASSPGYQFQQQQGNQVINAGGNPRTGTFSGNTLRDLATFNQGLAGTDFMQYLNQLNNAWGQNVSTQGGWQQMMLNALSGLSGSGQAAAANSGTALLGGANQVGNLLAGIGQSQAAGTLGGASLLSGGITNALKAISTPGAGGQSSLSWLASLFGRGGGGGGGSGGGDFPGELA